MKQVQTGLSVVLLRHAFPLNYRKINKFASPVFQFSKVLAVFNRSVDRNFEYVHRQPNWLLNV